MARTTWAFGRCSGFSCIWCRFAYTVYNCIIWNNTNSMGRVSDISEYYLPVITPNWTMLWSCYSDMVPWLSTDTSYCEDPQFVDPDNGDYTLQEDALIYTLAPEFESLPVAQMGRSSAADH